MGLSPIKKITETENTEINRRLDKMGYPMSSDVRNWIEDISYQHFSGNFDEHRRGMNVVRRVFHDRTINSWGWGYVGRFQD
jgi:hypothetical protein